MRKALTEKRQPLEEYNPHLLYLRQILSLKRVRGDKKTENDKSTELAGQIAEGDIEAFICLVERNLGLVFKIAEKFKGRRVPFLDLVSEGNIGLMRAAQLFKPESGASFGTYAGYWIEQRMRRAITQQAPIIQIPEHVQYARIKIARFKDDFMQENGFYPDNSIIAKHLELDEERVQQYSCIPIFCVGLDDPVNMHESSPTIEEKISLEDELESAHRKIYIDRLKDLPKFLDLLEPREKEVLKRRFGLGSTPEETLQEIGNSLGLERERVRQIQNKAKRKLLRWMVSSEDPDSLSSMTNVMMPDL